MQRLFMFMLALCATGCGVESTLPASSDPSSGAPERAVFVSRVEKSNNDYTVTCRLNEILVTPGLVVPVFIEFNGQEIERVNLENTSSHTFHSFSPPGPGTLFCVVIYSDAQFESERHTISQ